MLRNHCKIILDRHMVCHRHTMTNTKLLHEWFMCDGHSASLATRSLGPPERVTCTRSGQDVGLIWWRCSPQGDPHPGLTDTGRDAGARSGHCRNQTARACAEGAPSTPRKRRARNRCHGKSPGALLSALHPGGDGAKLPGADLYGGLHRRGLLASA